MDKLDMFQEIFGKVDRLGWWDMERIKTDDGTHFTSKEYQEVIYIHGAQIELTEPHYQEMNGQVEVTWRAL